MIISGTAARRGQLGRRPAGGRGACHSQRLTQRRPLRGGGGASASGDYLIYSEAFSLVMRIASMP